MSNKPTCTSLIDGSIYTERPVLSLDDAKAYVQRATDAQQTWASLPLSVRIERVVKGVAAVGEMNDYIVTELAWQMGKPVRYGGEFGGFNERASYIASIAESALETITMSDDGDFIVISNACRTALYLLSHLGITRT